MAIEEHEFSPEHFEKIQNAWKKDKIIRLKIPESVESAQVIRNYPICELYVIPLGKIDAPLDTTILQGILPTKRGAVQVYIKKVVTGPKSDEASEDPYTIVHIHHKESGAKYIVQIGTNPAYALEKALAAGDEKMARKYAENVFKKAVLEMEKGREIWDAITGNVSQLTAFDVITRNYIKGEKTRNFGKIRNIVTGDFKVFERFKRREGPLTRILQREDPIEKYKASNVEIRESTIGNEGIFRKFARMLGISPREYYAIRDPTEEEKQILQEEAVKKLKSQVWEDLLSHRSKADPETASIIMETLEALKKEFLKDPEGFARAIREENEMKRQIVQQYLRSHQELVSGGNIEAIAESKLEQWNRLTEKGKILFERKLKMKR